MKTKFFAILLTLAMLTPTLAACGNTIPDETAPDTDVQETVGEEEIPDTLPLVKDGVSEYVIVRGENASLSEITASTELQSYLKQITGAELPIVTDATPAVVKEIIVGKTNREAEGAFDRDELGDEGFVIKTENGKLWLVGGEVRGTLYAVYTFLEDYLGCRFYTAYFEKIPETKTISLKIEEDKQIPVFEVRNIYWYDTRGVNLGAKFKLNMGENVSEEYGGQLTYAGGACHTIPEYAETGSGAGADPCLSDENIYQTVLKNVRAALEANPDARFISVSQGDVLSGYCTCDTCNASYEIYGQTGHYLNFVNRIAGEIKDDYPNVRVHTWGYQFTLMPPKGGVVPADNVMIQICTIEACFSHPISECSWAGGQMGDRPSYFPEDVSFAQLFVEWGKLTDYLCVWDYTTNYAFSQVTQANFTVLRENLQFFADNNVKYVFEQGNAINAEFSGLRSYLLCKLMWDPYMSEEEYYGYMNEFLQDYYGPGWKSIRAYIDLAEEASDANHFGCWSNVEVLYPTTKDETNKNRELPTFTADQLKNYMDIDWTQYYEYLTVYKTNPVITEGYLLFAEALAKAETDEQRHHIEKSTIQLDYMQSWPLNKQTLQNSSNVNKIFKNAVDICVKDGSLTKEEGNALKESFQTDVVNVIKAQYAVYNRNLAQKLMDYSEYGSLGALLVDGATTITKDNIDILDYTSVPASCFRGRNWFGD